MLSVANRECVFTAELLVSFSGHYYCLQWIEERENMYVDLLPSFQQELGMEVAGLWIIWS